MRQETEGGRISERKRELNPRGFPFIKQDPQFYFLSEEEEKDRKSLSPVSVEERRKIASDIAITQIPNCYHVRQGEAN